MFIFAMQNVQNRTKIHNSQEKNGNQIQKNTPEIKW